MKIEKHRNDLPVYGISLALGGNYGACLMVELGRRTYFIWPNRS